MGCIVMNNISFDNVYLLLIAIPLIALFAVPFALAVRKDNRNGHNVASMVIHVVLAITIAFAAAGTSFTTVLTETHVYVVADVSYSASRNLDTIDNYIKNLQLPRNSKIGLVCFAKDYQLVNGLGAKNALSSVKTATVDDTETNIAEALTWTGTLFGNDAIKRIVLITDGKQTDESDGYAVKRAVDGLEAQNVKVDAIYLNDNITGEQKEVQISSVQYTHNAYLNHEERAIVSVQSSHATRAFVTLYEGGMVVDEQAVQLTLGTNVVNLDLNTSFARTYDYEVRVRTEYEKDDESDYNNNYTFTQTVFSDMNVLVVSASWADCVAAVARYGERANLDIYDFDENTSAALKQSFVSQNAGNPNITFHLRTSTKPEVPYQIEKLCSYDEFLLANIDLSQIDNYTAFVTNLDAAVSKYGKSLVTMGNLNVQNREEAVLKSLQDMLPVRFGNNDDTRMCTILIDASRSMRTTGHLVIAKEVAIRLLDVLQPNDYVCVIKFDGDFAFVQDPSPFSECDKLVEKIKNIEMRQGTLIGKSLLAASGVLEQYSYFDNKQVMLITDGEDYTGYDPGEPGSNAASVAAEMLASGIVTSVFDVGRANIDDASDLSWKAKLEAIAASGGGKYFFHDNRENFDNVEFGEIAESVTGTLVEAETTVNVDRRTDGVMGGLGSELPSVDGYIYGTIKASATTVLTLNHRVGTSDETRKRPLFAYWKYGSGMVSTFTSSSEYLSKWSSAGVDDVFFDNVLEEATPAEKTSYPFNLQVTLEGKKARVEVTPASQHLNRPPAVSVTITLPGGETLTAAMTPNSANNLFTYSFDAPELGKYGVSVVYTYISAEYTAETDFHKSYLPEYNAFAQYDSSILHRAIDGRGKVIDDTLDANGNLRKDVVLKIENDDREIAKQVYPLTIPLLIASVVLFVVDIIVRKLKWSIIKSFFSRKKKTEGNKK